VEPVPGHKPDRPGGKISPDHLFPYPGEPGERAGEPLLEL
jgi:hypothetical protein